MWIVAQSLDEIITVDRAELNVVQTMIFGELTRNFVRDIEMPPIVYVHAPSFIVVLLLSC
jgi:hypothetical protein